MVLSLEDVSSMKLAELRAQLETRGLDSKGGKKVLVKRLQHAIIDEAEGEDQRAEDRREDEEPELVEEGELAGQHECRRAQRRRRAACARGSTAPRSRS